LPFTVVQKIEYDLEVALSKADYIYKTGGSQVKNMVKFLTYPDGWMMNNEN